MSIKLSVVIPCFNEDKRIDKCLESILNQEEMPHEIIVVDGHSTDNTREIVKKYTKKNNRVKLFLEKGDRSPANARNIGWKNATGSHILFLDADSICGDNFFKIIKDEINGCRCGEDIIFYPSIINSIKELWHKYFWYGKTIPKYIMKNRKDYKTMLRMLTATGLFIFPFISWNLFFLNLVFILILSAWNGLKTYKKSGEMSFLFTVPLYIIFIFIANGLGVISIPFLYLIGKYEVGR